MARRIRRILLGLLIAVVAVVVLVAGSILIDTLLGRGRLDAVTNTVIPNRDGSPVRAYVARPTTPGPHPGLVMIHEFWGLNEDIVGKADALAQEGYVVVAPDTFKGRTTGWVPSAIWQVVSTPAQQVDADVDAAYVWLAGQPQVRPERIGILGFCFGGATSLRYSLSNPYLASTVVFYGSLITDPARLKALSGPVLGVFGGADQSIPLTEVRAFEAGLQQAGVKHQISVYEGQPHAFVKNVEGIRQGGAQGQAWAELLAFLNQNLKGTRAERPSVTPIVATDGLSARYLFMLAWSHLSHH